MPRAVRKKPEMISRPSFVIVENLTDSSITIVNDVDSSTPVLQLDPRQKKPVSNMSAWQSSLRFFRLIDEGVIAYYQSDIVPAPPPQPPAHLLINLNPTAQDRARQLAVLRSEAEFETFVRVEPIGGLAVVWDSRGKMDEPEKQWLVNFWLPVLHLTRWYIENLPDDWFVSYTIDRERRMKILDGRIAQIRNMQAEQR